MDNARSLLSSFDFLAGLPASALREMAERLRETTLAAGTILFRQGDEGDALYLILDGTLDIEQDQVHVVVRGPGEVVGEFALIDGNHRSATVRAATDVRMLEWPREDFQHALEHHRPMVLGILKVMTDKLRQAGGGRPGREEGDTRPPGVSPEVRRLTFPADDWAPETTIVYRSESMRALLALIVRLKDNREHVLITGESGSGKEMIARAIHHYSACRNGPYVGLNCGAIPEALAESELFGHERGAFTGAAAVRRGKIEVANGGTLFLDEIGELPPSIQVKLLRFLDDGRFMRVGGEKPLRGEVRIVAATHHDLKHEVQAGRFRKDLFYRLSTILLEVPPLRERPEDIAPLAAYFLSRASHPPKRLAPGVMEHLQAQPWNGNARELRNVIERTVVITEEAEIRLDAITTSVRMGAGLDVEGTPPRTDAALDLESLRRRLDADDRDLDLLEWVEQVLVQTALAQSNGNQNKAAALLGIDRRLLARRLKKNSPS